MFDVFSASTNTFMKWSTCVFLIGFLSGCAPEPSNSENTAAIGQIEQWEVTLNSVGALQFGMNLEEASIALGEPASGTDGSSNGECTYVSFPSMPTGMYVMVLEGTISRIDFARELVIRSTEGIGTGSTLDEAIAVFGDLAVVSRNKYGSETDLDIEVSVGEYPDGNGYVFESSEGVIHSWRVGNLEPVGWVEGCS